VGSSEDVSGKGDIKKQMRTCGTVVKRTSNEEAVTLKWCVSRDEKHSLRWEV